MSSVIIHIRSLILFLLQIIRKIIFTLIRWLYTTISYIFIFYMVWWIIAETAYSPIYSFEKFEVTKWMNRYINCENSICIDGCSIYNDLVRNKLKIGMPLKRVSDMIGSTNIECKYDDGKTVYSHGIGQCVWQPHIDLPSYKTNVFYLFFDADEKLIAIRDNIDAFFFANRHYAKLDYGECKFSNGEVKRDFP